ncbi:MAG: DUF294 nucleotidyltransferase-like domain-containing protein, partial [Candidatus Hydrogenedentes bacterium]|nr:DUF294 nucleotidyltransferase-like domain-containing protein [Candidatus Hydrogenedentota bacterium]
MSEFSEYSFLDLVKLAEEDPAAFRDCPPRERLAAIQGHYRQAWQAVQERHSAGSSGRSVLTRLSKSADELVRGIVKFGLAETDIGSALRQRIAVVALGGYGRGELSPRSDLDLCLLYTGKLDAELGALNDFLVPIFWDVGFKMGYVLHRVDEAMALAAAEPEVFTSYSQARLLLGDDGVFGELETGVDEIQHAQSEGLMTFLRKRESLENIPEEYQDLYHPEPDLKENVGGLRDAHIARWIIGLRRG